MKTFLCSVLVFSTLLLCGCYEAKTFAALPDNYSDRVNDFKQVSTILSHLQSASAEELLPLASHPDERVRRAAVLRLASATPTAPMVNKLTQLLTDDPSASVRTAAARTLGALRDPGGLGALVLALCDKDPNARLFAWKSVLRAGEDGNTAILEGLSSASTASTTLCSKATGPKVTVRHEIRELLLAMENRAIPIMEKGLLHENRSVVGTSLDVLGRRGQSASSALPDILALMENPDEEIRAAGLAAIGRIGDRHPGVMPAVLRAQADPSRKVQMAAAAALAAIRGNTRRSAGRPGRPFRRPTGPQS
jgi:HEAT repeat protein